MNEWQPYFEILKIVGPLVTGGLAGAILTYFFNQRVARRRIPVLDLNVENNSYAIGSSSDSFANIKVSYKGQDHENISLYKVSIRNPSARTVLKSPILLVMSKDCNIIDQSSSTLPTKRQVSLTKEASANNAYVWDAGELKPGDSAETKILLSPAVTVEWSWRGDDDVEITSRGQQNSLTVDRQIKTTVFWIAFFLACGSVPIFGGLAQAFLLLFTAPSIVSFAQRILYYFGDNEDKITITTGSNSSFLVATGGSTISPSSNNDPNKLP